MTLLEIGKVPATKRNFWSRKVFANSTLWLMVMGLFRARLMQSLNLLTHLSSFCWIVTLIASWNRIPSSLAELEVFSHGTSHFLDFQ